MRLIVFVLLFLAKPVWSITCFCELRAKSPIHGLKNSYDNKVMSFRGNYHGIVNYKTVHECRAECAQMVEDKVDQGDLKVELGLRAQEMVDKEQIGYNCTGPTTFKFPVEMRAYLDKLSLGPTYKSLEVVHVDKKCFEWLHFSTSTKEH